MYTWHRLRERSVLRSCVFRSWKALCFPCNRTDLAGNDQNPYTLVRKYKDKDRVRLTNRRLCSCCYATADICKRSNRRLDLGPWHFLRTNPRETSDSKYVYIKFNIVIFWQMISFWVNVYLTFQTKNIIQNKLRHFIAVLVHLFIIRYFTFMCFTSDLQDPELHQ